MNSIEYAKLHVDGTWPHIGRIPDEQWTELRYVPINTLNLERFPEYQISDLGRVREKVSKRILSECHHYSGRAQVIVKHDGGSRRLYINRASVASFFGLPDTPRTQSDHINFRRWDNRVSNLRWEPLGYSGPKRKRYKWDVKNTSAVRGALRKLMKRYDLSAERLSFLSRRTDVDEV